MSNAAKTLGLPGCAPSLPQTIRARMGFFDHDRNAPDKQRHWDLAREDIDSRGSGDGQVRYNVDEQLMIRLAGKTGLLHGANNPDEASAMWKDRGAVLQQKIRHIPIELYSNEPSDWFMYRLSMWQRCGPQCLGTEFRPKTPAEIAAPEQQRLLLAKELPLQPMRQDFQYRAEYWTGQFERFAYAPKTIKRRNGQTFTVKVQCGRQYGTCDPLTCEHFRPANPKLPACKPEVRLHMLLPWAPHDCWAFMASTGWKTASKMLGTIGILHKALNGNIGGQPLTLGMVTKKGRTPDGTRQDHPIAFLSPGKPIEELRANAASTAALPAHEPQLALPTPAEFAVEHDGRTSAFVDEFHPEAAQQERYPGELQYIEDAKALNVTPVSAEAKAELCGWDFKRALRELREERGTGEGGETDG